jgi:hypothetical protein
MSAALTPPLAAPAARPQHRDTPENTDDTPWVWTEESKAKIDMYLKRYPDTAQGKMSAIMPLLWTAQQQTDVAHVGIKAKAAHGNAMVLDSAQGSGGWVPLAAMNAIADICGCPVRAAPAPRPRRAAAPPRRRAAAAAPPRPSELGRWSRARGMCARDRCTSSPPAPPPSSSPLVPLPALARPRRRRRVVALRARGVPRAADGGL